MIGYILYRGSDDRLLRLDGQRSSRKRLIRELEDSVPPNSRIVGLVLSGNESRHLHLIDEAA
ncbi:hypothetical protein [Frondihabitans cladoniiphilus]|uniref:Uncharacterized protein n=1 Tax=Frondihabitans cladoniiphilus TaxID=715785 RepID=A0ABP8VIN4_9MICO